MKLLVTGGAGFIGANFIHYWTTHHPDDNVVNLDALTYAGNIENLTPVEQNPHYRFIQGDIADYAMVDKSMVGIDTVVHFAAETHVDRSIVTPALFVKTNVIGTQVLLDVALKHSIKRFHHVSTDEVFGELELTDLSKFDERTAYNPRSPYAASKAGADHLVRSYYHTFGLPITITNCSNNYGPYQFPEKFIPLAITNILENKKVPIYGDGLYVRDWLYVEDHCRGIEAVLNGGKIGETYCMGGLTSDINNMNVINKILKCMGKDESVIEFVKDRPGHDRRYAMDWSKIRKDLGWTPMHDFDIWLKQTIDWYANNESWWRRVKSDEYQTYYPPSQNTTTVRS